MFSVTLHILLLDSATRGCLMSFSNQLLARLCRSTIEGGGDHIFVPGLRGDGTKIAPPGDLYEQPPSEMS